MTSDQNTRANETSRGVGRYLLGQAILLWVLIVWPDAWAPTALGALAVFVSEVP